MEHKIEAADSTADAPGNQMPAARTPVWSGALFGALCAGFLLLWLSMALRYPYYFLFDMDLLAALEALNINSGIEPWVALHPGYGMYVFDAFTLRFAAYWHLVSAGDLHSLGASLSPILPMAELTSFFRLHSPILVFVIALCLWGAIAGIGRFSPLISILVLAAIASSEGLAYHASMIRVDLYSVFFWSLALPLAALAASTRRQTTSTALLIAAGFLLGIAFLTKIQSGVHLMAAAILYWQVRSLPKAQGVVPPQSSDDRRVNQFGVALAAINLCALAALLFAARNTVGQQATLSGIVENPGTYAGYPSRRAVSVVVAAFVLLALQIPWAERRPLLLVSRAARTITFLVTGGVFAILSPLLLYRNPSIGMRYALHNLQNLFWTKLFGFRSQLTTETILIEMSKYRWWMIAALVGAWLVVATATLASRKPRPWAAFTFATAWVCFAAVVSLSVVRPIPRDVLWFDTAYSLAAFISLAAACRIATRGRRTISAVTASIAVLVCTGNAVRLVELPGRMDTNYHLYSWLESPWFGTVFATPQFNDMMADRYPAPARAAAARQTRAHYRLRTYVTHIFQNEDVTLANVGPLARGRPVWRNHREWLVSDFPRGYASAHVVDVLEMEIKSRSFLSHVLVHEEWLNRIVPPPAEAGGQAPGDPVRALSILPRRDLEVVLFVTAEDLARVPMSNPATTVATGPDYPLQLALANQALELRLYGVVLSSYTVLSAADFAGPYVFLVREQSDLPVFLGASSRGEPLNQNDTPGNTSAQSANPNDSAVPSKP